MADIQVASARHGGKRRGAGRQSLEAKVLRDTKWFEARGISPLTAQEILSHVTNERAKWKRVLDSEDDRVVLSALVFLTTMRDGKPAQSINVTSTNFNLHARDIETARAIVAEIRGDAHPSLGRGDSSPLQVDGDLDSNQVDTLQADDTKGDVDVVEVDNNGLVTDSMLSEHEGGILGGIGNG